MAVADVALLVDSADEPARQTLTAAMTREGWRVADGPPAACAVVVWSERSVTSDGLAALARPFLDERRLLQVLWQPDAWDNSRQSYVVAREPFVYHQALVVEKHELNGSDAAVDWFAFRLSEGENILAELARLGSLSRPRDQWNARIVFGAPFSRFRKVTLVEYAPDDGRVLRRWAKTTSDPIDEDFETAIGNRW